MRVYSDGPDGPCGVGLPCGKRSCSACRPRWIRRGHLVILSGFDLWATVGDFRALTLTAPGMDRIGSADGLVAWNESHSRRVKSFLTMLRRLAPGLDFVRVLELQRRGAIHSHWIVRGASGVSKRQVRRLAVAAGFGSQLDWSAVRTMAGLARYLVGYMMKSRDVFPAGTRVLVCSQGWTVASSVVDDIGDVDPESVPEPVVQAEPFGAAAAQLGRAVVSAEVWIGGPPPGIGWTAWADDAVMIAAGRRVLRHRRMVADREAFEGLTRDRWLRWEASVRGRAAVGRLTRGRGCQSVGSRAS